MRLSKPSLVGLTAALGLALAPTASKAAPDVTITVSAEVIEACSIDGTPALAFGDYDPTVAGADTGNASFTVTCTNSTGYTVTFDGGQNETGGSFAMAGPTAGEVLLYELTVAGTAVAPNGTITGTGTGSADTVAIVGSIPAGQYVTAGTYGDTVIATISL
jgi:spore coat protein U-like protein